ncbi:hypothetical protein E2C01_010212 [Portunus trituberculatus]|uniref:Uncharacterized protein n=1 Tax=Portunus trituberculatus TaxID=210409 RepID=A0A5B7D7S1_PORTR|nr:hypothetical protein [Portunus trituberculatus]
MQALKKSTTIHYSSEPDSVLDHKQFIVLKFRFLPCTVLRSQIENYLTAKALRIVVLKLGVRQDPTSWSEQVSSIPTSPGKPSKVVVLGRCSTKAIILGG